MVAIVTRKGNRNHRLSGKLYFGSMALVALSAITLTMIRPSQLLLSLGVFSFYLALTGYRALAHKRLHHDLGVTTIDWAAAVVTIIFSATLLQSGLTGGEKTEEGQAIINVTSIFFGVLGIVLVSGTIYRIAPSIIGIVIVSFMIARYQKPKSVQHGS